MSELPEAAPKPVKPPRRRRKRSLREKLHQERGGGIQTKAVHAGMRGGRYRPLTDPELERVHHTALDVLAKIGVGSPTDSMLEAVLPKGAELSENGRLCFPRSLMEDVIAGACREFTHYAPNPEYDLQIGGDRVHFRTCGEPVQMFDYQTREVRPSRIEDLYDSARLVDRMDNIHSFCQTVVATEHSEDAYTHDINVLYAQLAGTQKPLSMSTATVENLEHFIELLDMYLGGEGEFLKRPCFTFGGCPIVSPLRFGPDNAEVLVKSAQLGIAYDIAVASQAGATAPAALAGALVQTFSETLAALAVVNLINPGTPFLMGAWPFISDLRTGSFTGGSGEQAIVSAATAQLCNFYGLPSSVSACMSDSKLPDAQAGYEKGIAAALSAVAGCNYIGESAGMLGSLMACSLEGIVIDNEMLGAVMRTVRGIEVTDETLSFDVIQEAVLGVGHFLGSSQTLELMESDYVYPQIADRSSYSEWKDSGKRDIFDSAHDKVTQVLSEHYPVYIDPAVDEKIRARFPITLKREDMQKGSGRW